jgi:hypothetical protein
MSPETPRRGDLFNKGPKTSTGYQNPQLEAAFWSSAEAQLLGQPVGLCLHDLHGSGLLRNAI